VYSEEDISYAGCKRVAIKVQVAPDAEQGAVDATLQQILDDKKAQWDDVTVWGYSNNVDPSLLGADKGTKTYSTCQ